MPLSTRLEMAANAKHAFASHWSHTRKSQKRVRRLKKHLLPCVLPSVNIYLMSRRSPVTVIRTMYPFWLVISEHLGCISGTTFLTVEGEARRLEDEKVNWLR